MREDERIILVGGPHDRKVMTVRRGTPVVKVPDYPPMSGRVDRAAKGPVRVNVGHSTYTRKTFLHPESPGVEIVEYIFESQQR